MNSTNTTITIPNMIELNKCPGYFVNIKDGCLYSIKSGTVKRLKLQRTWRHQNGYPRPTGEYGYHISIAGRRRAIPVSTCKDVVLEWTRLNATKKAGAVMNTPVPVQPDSIAITIHNGVTLTINTASSMTLNINGAT